MRGRLSASWIDSVGRKRQLCAGDEDTEQDFFRVLVGDVGRGWPIVIDFPISCGLTGVLFSCGLTGVLSGSLPQGIAIMGVDGGGLISVEGTLHHAGSGQDVIFRPVAPGAVPAKEDADAFGGTCRSGGVVDGNRASVIPDPFQPGVEVKLRSGGQPMTVIAVGPAGVTVALSGACGLDLLTLPRACLVVLGLRASIVGFSSDEIDDHRACLASRA